MVRFLVAAALLSACATAQSPELRVLGVHDAPQTTDLVFLQVTNPADHPMRLTKLAYTFAAAGTTVAKGEVPLEREVPAGAAVVVEVPFDGRAAAPMTLRGSLTAELDQIVRTFQVSAQIQLH